MSDTTTSKLGPARSAARARRLFRVAAPYLILSLVSMLAVLVHVSDYTKISPVDELQHIDYLYKAPRPVGSGEKVSQDAMREESCRLIDAGFVPPPCDGREYNPNDFQETGTNTAAVNTPVYYTLTKMVAVPLGVVAGFESLVTGGRLAGGLWLGLALCLAYYVGRRWGGQPSALLACLILVALAPSVLFLSSTITPDAMTLLCGALILWGMHRWQVRARGYWWTLAAVIAFAPLVKMTNLVMAMAAGIYVLISSWRGFGPQRQARLPITTRGLVTGAIVAAAAFVPLIAYMAYAKTIDTGANPMDTPMVAQFTVDKFPILGLFDSLAILTQPLGSVVYPVGPESFGNSLQRVVSLLMTGGLIAAALFVRQRRVTALGWAALVASLVAGEGFVFFGYYGSSVYIPLPTRYGASLVPAMAMLTALLCRSLPSRIFLWGMVVFAVGITYLRIVYY